MNTLFRFVFSVAILTPLALRAQTYDELLSRYNSQLTPAIFLHTDQEFYVPGETIWFKAYIYKDGKPISGNTNLYTRLISPGGQVLLTQIHPVTGAVAAGGFVIPDTVGNGMYQVQVSTTAMLPAGKSFHFPVAITKNSKIRKDGDLVVEFFPEGGQLIGNCWNMIAVQASVGGMPVQITGNFMEGEAEMGTVQTYPNGVGSFGTFFRANKTFEFVTDWQGQRKVFQLPAPLSAGIQLHVEEEKDGKTFQLTRVADSGSKTNQVVDIVAQINGKIVYEAEAAFESYRTVKGHLVTSQLPSGVLHFAVFDKNKKLLAERLTFIDNGEFRIRGEITRVSGKSSSRAHQELSLSFPGDKELSASVAISHAEISNRDNIISHFLLTSGVSDHVHDPYWYFRTPSDSTRKALDFLLMTQQYKGFSWNDVISFKEGMQTNHLPDLVSVSGLVRDDRNRETLGPGRLNFYVEAEDSTTVSYEAAVREDGSFRLDSMSFAGKAKLYYAYADPQGRQKSAKITLNEDERLKAFARIAVPAPSPIVFEKGLSSDMNQRLGQLKNHEEQVKILERVTLKVRNKRPTETVEDTYTTGVFKMQAAKTLDNINEPSRDVSMSVVDYIRNRMNEVELTRTGFVNRKTLSMGSQTRWPVGLFLDESPVDLAMLRTVRVGDVALVKFFDVGWVGVGSTYPGGALAVFTKRQSESDFKPQKLEHVVTQGYTLSKPFLEIDYGQKEIKHADQDNRHTLLWEPGIVVPPGERKTKLNFYTGDIRNPWRINVQGFDGEGKLLYEEVEFK